jgi:hypothetical protein
VVEREMTLIEMTVKKIRPSDQAEAERSMRTLATISRTLREIRAINQPDGAIPPDEARQRLHTPRYRRIPSRTCMAHTRAY